MLLSYQEHSLRASCFLRCGSGLLGLVSKSGIGPACLFHAGLNLFAGVFSFILSFILSRIFLSVLSFKTGKIEDTSKTEYTNLKNPTMYEAAYVDEGSKIIQEIDTHLYLHYTVPLSLVVFGQQCYRPMLPIGLPIPPRLGRLRRRAERHVPLPQPSDELVPFSRALALHGVSFSSCRCMVPCGGERCAIPGGARRPAVINGRLIGCHVPKSVASLTKLRCESSM